jgi:iron-sulfur cluster assembly accessory protein
LLITGGFNLRREKEMSATTAPAMTLNVSESAATEIKKFMAGEEGLPETAGLRVRVVPGGCSGFQYSLNIEEESRQGDFILDEKGVRLFVDMFSAQYLNGVEIDYVTNMMGSGFTFNNPNATGGCGCGSSFTA